MDRDAITIALPKGRLLADCLDLFARIGLPSAQDADGSRQLILPSRDGTARFLVLRDKDLPTYLDYGAADLGVAGKDVLMEAGRDLVEPLDLGFGPCRIVVAEPAARRATQNGRWGRIRVATKYPRITAEHFAGRGEQVEIIPLYGSIELAPLVGLADRIVDLVSTGETLRQNHLVELETIASVTARLVVNRASLKTRADRLIPLIERIADELGKNANEKKRL